MGSSKTNKSRGKQPAAPLQTRSRTITARSRSCPRRAVLNQAINEPDLEVITVDPPTTNMDPPSTSSATPTEHGPEETTEATPTQSEEPIQTEAAESPINEDTPKPSEPVPSTSRGPTESWKPKPYCIDGKPVTVMKLGELLKIKAAKRIQALPNINTASTVTTKNRFGPLMDMETEEGPQQTRGDANVTRKPVPTQPGQTNEKKPKKPPPIVVHGVPDNTKLFCNKIADIIKNRNFYIKNSYRGERTSIFVDAVEDYRTLLNSLGAEDCAYHTFTLQDDKTRAHVIRGLAADTDLEEVKAELYVRYGLETEKIFKMKTTREPLLLITLHNKDTTQQLNARVKFLAYTKITWERYTSSRSVIQCHRCQEWGHATANCRARYRCLKCAQNHQTNTCTKPITEPAICANCSGAHPANSVDCPVYIRISQSRYNAAAKGKATGQKAPGKEHFPPMFRPAPQPLVNVWEQRKRAATTPTGPPQQQQQHQQQRQQQCASERVREDVRGSVRAGANVNVNVSDSFYGLMDEIDRLDKNIDIKSTLRAIRELNDILESRPLKPSDKFKIFLEFCSRLDG